MKNELFRHQNSVEFIIPSKNLTFFVNPKFNKKFFLKISSTKRKVKGFLFYRIKMFKLEYSIFKNYFYYFLLISDSMTNLLHPMANSWNGREWWTTKGHHWRHLAPNSLHWHVDNLLPANKVCDNWGLILLKNLKKNLLLPNKVWNFKIKFNIISNSLKF